MDILQQVGAAALGSRFRRLAEKFTADAASLYKWYGVELEPSWFPILYLLSDHKSVAITEIASLTGQSHPFISKTIRQMKAKELVHSLPSAKDKRINKIALTEKGLSEWRALQPQLSDVSSAMQTLLEEVDSEFVKRLDRLDNALDQESFYNRVKAERRQRECTDIKIIEFDLEYQNAFYELNKRWIQRYFTLEPADLKALTSPKEYILDNGGKILLAQTKNGDICGTVALIAMNPGVYELAKMAVDDNYQGLGIGEKLGYAAIEFAKSKGASKLFLESNRKLVPAIHLYTKLGFVEVESIASPYERCDIQMELNLLV